VSYQRGERVIFDRVSLEIRTGKITAILGPSGSGKTTLLRLISGHLAPTSGVVEVDGHDVASLSTSELLGLRRQMGMLFQSGALLTDLDVFDNVAFPVREHTDLSPAMIRSLVLMKLQLVGLRGARHLYPRELSGGMARRAALARAIALDPKLVMYDEPFAGQDPITMGVLVRLIRQLNRALGLTTIIVSHDIAETTSIADYMYLLADGRIVASGTPDELRATKNPSAQQFMHGESDGPVPFHYPALDFWTDLTGARQ
jgi:phospholipid/cholesterol/gamma-HCH transport system ATP-binding protein